MKRPKHSPKLQKAIVWLKDYAQNLPSQARIPPLRELSGLSGISLVTMHKAITALSRQNVFQVIPRGGIFVSSQATHPKDLCGKLLTKNHDSFDTKEEFHKLVPKWKMVADQIKSDLLRNIYPPASRLPSAKELALRYRTSGPTLRKACLELSAQKLIQSDKKGFTVESLQAQKKSARILILAKTELRNNLTWMAPWSPDVWREIDTVSWRSNVSIVRRSFDQVIYDTHDTQQLINDKSTLGILILSLGLANSEIEMLKSRLNRSVKPVSIIDETNYPLMHEKTESLKYARIFMLGCGTQCGIEMGRYLSKKGHKRLVVLLSSPESEKPWIHSRIAGLRKGFEGDIRMYWPQGLSGNRDSETLLYADSASENLLAQISSYKKNSGGQCEMFDYPFEHRIVPEFLENRLLYKGFSALLDQLFKTQTQIDCIVGVNDTIALIAQQYLLSANSKRLSTLTLAGFDDSAMAHANNLTSYNWNTTAIIQAAFEHLLQTPRSLYLSSKRITEVPGFIVARTSAPDKYGCR